MVNCCGNYNASNAASVYRVPRHWPGGPDDFLKFAPKRADRSWEDFKTVFICGKHWPHGYVPNERPTVFAVPPSMLPTPSPKARPTNKEDRQLQYFMEADKIRDFDDFHPENFLKSLGPCLMKRNECELVCAFFHDETFSSASFSVHVKNEPTLTGKLIVKLFSNGQPIACPLLHKDHGLNSKDNFQCIIKYCFHRERHINEILSACSTLLSDASQIAQNEQRKRLIFLRRQIDLNIHKEFQKGDFIQFFLFYPRIRYAKLREFLVLASDSTMRNVVSNVNVEKVMSGLLPTLSSPICMLIIDETKIRPRIIFANKTMTGQTEAGEVATGVLGVMVKFLHGGPSVMVHLKPIVQNLAQDQFNICLPIIQQLESHGAIVIGSITDDHKVNQKFMRIFPCLDGSRRHPLDNDKPWFHLFDPVHLLKRIRDNWLTEKLQQLELIPGKIAKWKDIIEAAEKEKENLLKTTGLYNAALRPSTFERQNVKHVLAVFNEKVVAQLRLNGHEDTAVTVKLISDWFKFRNVCSLGEDKRFNDENRKVSTFVKCFELLMHIFRIFVVKFSHYFVSKPELSYFWYLKSLLYIFDRSLFSIY